MMIAQDIDAAAGGDPNVCLKATAEANKLEKVTKSTDFKFRGLGAELRPAHDRAQDREMSHETEFSLS